MYGLTLYKDTDDPDTQRLLRCKSVHAEHGRCEMEKRHLLPHLIEIDNQHYVIWPDEPLPSIVAEHPEWFF